MLFRSRLCCFDAQGWFPRVAHLRIDRDFRPGAINVELPAFNRRWCFKISAAQPPLVNRRMGSWHHQNRSWNDEPKLTKTRSIALNREHFRIQPSSGVVFNGRLAVAFVPSSHRVSPALACNSGQRLMQTLLVRILEFATQVPAGSVDIGQMTSDRAWSNRIAIAAAAAIVIDARVCAVPSARHMSIHEDARLLTAECVVHLPSTCGGRCV